MSYIIILVLVIIVFVKFSSLNQRVSRLEGQYSKEKMSDAAVTPNVGSPSVSSTNPNIPPVPITPTPVDVPGAGDKFVEWIKEDWLLKLGGLLLLIGLGWFTTYAFMNNWIGPNGRIMLGIGAGILLLVLGTWRIKKYTNQGGVFLVLGSAVIALTVFAAQEVYSMFTPTMALAIIFIGAAYIALISVKYNSLAVAFSGLVLSGLAPLLINDTQNDSIYLFSYLMIVVLGVIWIVAVRKNWGALVLGSVLMVFFHSLPILINGYRYRESGTMILNLAYAFALIFFISSLVSILKSKEGDLRAFLWTAIVNGIFLLSWILSYASEDWQSLIIALWMVIFAGGAFILFAETKIRSVFYVYASVAVAMLVAATGVELDGAALTLAYTIESALIPVLIYIVTRDWRASTASSFLMAGPIILSLEHLDKYLRSTNVLSEDFFVLLVLALALVGVGLMYNIIKKGQSSLNSKIDAVFLITGSAYVYTLIWAVFHIAMSEDQAVATTISLIIFTIIGLFKYFYGISVGSRILRNYGGIFLGLVVLRLVFVDVWRMEMGARIVVFVLVGLLLISTAFISRKIKSKVTETVTQ